MRQLFRFLLCFSLALSFCACLKDEPDDKWDKYGFERVYSGEGIPEIHVNVPLAQWDTLLARWDNNPGTKQYISCDVSYKDEEGTVDVKGAGLRLRGNTSRNRPEGWYDDSHKTHVKDSTLWNHFHLTLNLDKYTKDAAHKIRGLKKMHLKWFKDDPDYVREIYCYDLFKRFGVWTAPHSTYCRLWIKVSGDPKETYYGVYEILEPINSRYVKARKDKFEKADGFLWKCRWPASLNTVDADFGLDDGSDNSHVYEFKGEADEYTSAEAQLKDFILKLSGKGRDSFYKWIQEVCDVRLLLRTYAVNVTVGMWDDYWANSNNYYLYFNTKDKFDYKVFFIPFDYDNTLGTSHTMDAGRQDPFNWGNNGNPLIARLLDFEDFREIYKQALLELVDENAGLFYYTASMDRIRKWQDSIRDYVPNDTGWDMEIYDAPAYWGHVGDYLLLTTGNNNFFQVRTQTINNYCR